jgi:hypothetical protein
VGVHAQLFDGAVAQPSLKRAVLSG